jgi:hypothetical protein
MSQRRVIQWGKSESKRSASAEPEPQQDTFDGVISMAINDAVRTPAKLRGCAAREPSEGDQLLRSWAAALRLTVSAYFLELTFPSRSRT